MKTDKATQIHNLFVYAVLYATVCGISVWLLIKDKESPNNWILYAAMVVAILAGLVKLILHSRKRHQQSV